MDVGSCLLNQGLDDEGATSVHRLVKCSQTIIVFVVHKRFELLGPHPSFERSIFFQKEAQNDLKIFIVFLERCVL